MFITVYNRLNKVNSLISDWTEELKVATEKGDEIDIHYIEIIVYNLVTEASILEKLLKELINENI